MGEPVNPRSLQILDDGTLFALYDAGEDVYFRIFDSAGLVFDPTAKQFVAIGSTANDFIEATELAAIGGTGFSGYSAAVTLADLHNAGDVKPLVLLAFDNAAPADADVAILPPVSFSVQFGQLGRAPLTVQTEVSVKSTEGTAAQLKVWLDRDAQRIAVGTAGGTIFTAATSDVITSAGHGLNNGDVLLLTSSTTLPAGLSSGTPYYVRDKTTDTFKLAATAGGAAIDITDTGTGTHKWHKPTASLKLREHGSAAGVYLFEQDFTAAHLIDSCFEAEIADPNFTPDRQYDAEAIVVENGNTHESYHPHVVM